MNRAELEAIREENYRFRVALERIVRDSERDPMDDGIDAGRIARKALAYDEGTVIPDGPEVR